MRFVKYHCYNLYGKYFFMGKIFFCKLREALFRKHFLETMDNINNKAF